MSELTARLMTTQHDAFLTFIQQYTHLIRHTVWRVCGETYPALQADIEQEVYMALWKCWDADRGIDYPVSYLHKVALRTALAVLRSSVVAVLVDDVESCVLTRHDLSEDKTLTTEHAILLQTCLDQLPIEQARAVRAYLAGFTQREIAHLYGWSRAVARHRIYRGLEALKAFAVQEVI